MDIAAAEEEITRWKVAAEQEAAAGRAVEQEFVEKVFLLILPEKFLFVLTLICGLSFLVLISCWSNYSQSSNNECNYNSIPLHVILLILSLNFQNQVNFILFGRKETSLKKTKG